MDREAIELAAAAHATGTAIAIGPMAVLRGEILHPDEHEKEQEHDEQQCSERGSMPGGIVHVRISSFE